MQHNNPPVSTQDLIDDIEKQTIHQNKQAYDRKYKAMLIHQTEHQNSYSTRQDKLGAANSPSGQCGFSTVFHKYLYDRLR